MDKKFRWAISRNFQVSLNRALNLHNYLHHSFFLWGPRQTGKSTLLKETFKNSFFIDLLNSEELVRFSNSPELLREVQNDHIVIDEIQKIPQLLNEVHWLIENKNKKFALSGSSARKVKRGKANLLGGRALKFTLHGFSASELGEIFNLHRILNQGTLPPHYLTDENLSKMLLRSYISDYLKEEILEEGLTRSLPIFSRFLETAAICDTEILKYSNIASDCGVSSQTVREYYQILEDTYLGSLLPAYTVRTKRKVRHSPKFYFSDVGCVNQLAKRGEVIEGSQVFGKAFENWIFHELKTYSEYSGKHFDLAYWSTSEGAEVDFILGDGEIALESKATKEINARHLKNIRLIDVSSVKKKIVVSLDKYARETEDKILILPYQEFIRQLWNGDII